MRVVYVVNGQVLDSSIRNGLVIIKGTDVVPLNVIEAHRGSTHIALLILNCRTSSTHCIA
jgi:hypothetical protein